MGMVALLVYAVIITVIAVSNKISALAILLFCAEKNTLPTNEQIQAYTLKAAKKLFHIPN